MIVVKTALIIEDTDANRIFFERLITQAGFTVTGVSNGRAALEYAEKECELGVAVIDMEVPDVTGLELVSRLRRRYPDACLIVATMHDEVSLMESAFQRGCDIFMVKPHGFMELFKRLTTIGSAGLHEAGLLVIDQYGPRQFKLAKTS
jgi:DNA-binding response OmpR family regulator